MHPNQQRGREPFFEIGSRPFFIFKLPPVSFSLFFSFGGVFLRPSHCGKPAKRRLLLTIFELRRLSRIYFSRLYVSWELTGNGKLVFRYLFCQALESDNVPPVPVLPIVGDVINTSNDVMFKEDPLLLYAPQKPVAEIPQFPPEISVYKVSFIHDAVFLKSKKTGNQFPKTFVTSASVVVLCQRCILERGSVVFRRDFVTKPRLP